MSTSPTRGSPSYLGAASLDVCCQEQGIARWMLGLQWLGGGSFAFGAKGDSWLKSPPCGRRAEAEAGRLKSPSMSTQNSACQPWSGSAGRSGSGHHIVQGA